MNLMVYLRVGGVLILALPKILKAVSEVLAEIPGDQPGERFIADKLEPALESIGSKIAQLLLK